jgi:hypothetical protein
MMAWEFNVQKAADGFVSYARSNSFLVGVTIRIGQNPPQHR